MRTIISYGSYYKDFVKTLTKKEIAKLEYVLMLLTTTDKMPTKFVKFIREGIFELRFEYIGNAYRIFFIFDDDKIVILFNGFQKKTEKTPENEINKAIKIKNEYYEYKEKQRKYDNKH